jgi:CHAT domain-containing protein
VERELEQISTEIETNDPLLNEAFTEANIKEQIQQNNFSAIHWKTHGVFSSDPTETFLVAYGDSIKANELQSLVQVASQDGQKPLELLVLSACETARGDNRAILGLAGLTVRTGARSALSTLWRAYDRATTLLMTEFYQQLTQPGTTKAEALQQAQLSLLKQEGYFAPHYWGTYILVGNWL